MTHGSRASCTPASGTSAEELEGSHPGGNPGANLMSISHRCHLEEVAIVWELTKSNHPFAPGLSPGRVKRRTCDESAELYEAPVRLFNCKRAVSSSSSLSLQVLEGP